jgi:SAM-dependent methyltransferase
MHLNHAPESFDTPTKARFPVGVDFHHHAGKYRARIKRNGVRVTLGYFDTVDEAVDAYRAAKLAEPCRGDTTVALVRDYLQRNLGCKKKEVIHALNLDPRAVQRAIKIIRGQQWLEASRKMPTRFPDGCLRCFYPTWAAKLMRTRIGVVRQQTRRAFRSLAIAGMLSTCVADGASIAANDPRQHSRDYSHSFSQAEVWPKEFDDPSRDAWQKPGRILDALSLDRSAVVADVGAGIGYFSVQIAKRAPAGKLFAIDIEPDMLRYLSERARREHLNTIIPIVANEESANIPEPVDVILIVDTYHHIDNRIIYFARLKKSLRQQGRLAIVDFKPDSPEGPPILQRISAEKVTEELKAAGYSLVAAHPFLSRQYFLIFTPSGS